MLSSDLRNLAAALTDTGAHLLPALAPHVVAQLDAMALQARCLEAAQVPPGCRMTKRAGNVFPMIARQGDRP